MVEELQVPIHLKMTLTIKEAAAYSNIGINKIESYAAQSELPVCSLCWVQKAGQTQGVRAIYQP